MAKLTGKKEIEFLQGLMDELSEAMAKVSAQVKKGEIKLQEEYYEEERLARECEREGQGVPPRLWSTVRVGKIGRCRFSVERAWTPPERKWEEPEDLLTVFVTIAGRASHSGVEDVPPSSAYMEILNGEVRGYFFSRIPYQGRNFDSYLFVFDPKGRITRMNTSSGNEDLRKLRFKPLPVRAIPKLRKPEPE